MSGNVWIEVQKYNWIVTIKFQYKAVYMRRKIRVIIKLILWLFLCSLTIYLKLSHSLID